MRHNKPHGINRRTLLKSAAALPLLSFTPGLLASTKEAQLSQHFKAIPKTGKQIPVMGMGTSRTFNVDFKDSDAMKPLEDVLSTFYQMGGRVIDSSPMYGNAEMVSGKLVESLKLQNKLFTATKVWTDGREDGEYQMDRSIDFLKDKPLDLMQVHNLRDFKTHIETLKAWKAEGKIRYIGVTTSRVSVFPEVAELMKTQPLDFVQFNYSIGTRDAEQSLLPIAEDKGIATMINRPFERASLFRKTAGKELPQWAEDYQIESWGQFFLKYLISHPAVTTVIPATSKVKHMRDNMSAGFGTMPDSKARAEMENYFNSL